MTPRQIGRALLTLGAVLVFAQPARANLILNHSFEEPNVPTGGFSVFGSILGWTTIAGTGLEIQDHASGVPFEGDQLLELDGFDNSAIVQGGIPTDAGRTYLLSFAYSPRPGRSEADNGIDVFFDGGLVASLAVSGVGLTNTAWTIHSFLVTATGSTSSVGFAATGPSNTFGGYIDFVGLGGRSVPEPSTLLLVGTALAAAGVYRRRAH